MVYVYIIVNSNPSIIKYYFYCFMILQSVCDYTVDLQMLDSAGLLNDEYHMAPGPRQCFPLSYVG